MLEKHGHVGEEGQTMDNETWECERPRQPEEALPRLKVENFKKAAVAFRANTGIGIDGISPKVPLELSDELCEEMVVFLQNIDMAGVRSTNASTTLFS